MSRTGRPFSALAIAGSRLREPLCLYRSIFWTTRWSVQAFRTALEGGHRSYPISEEQEPDGQNKPKDGGKSNNRNPEVAERILEVIQHSPVRSEEHTSELQSLMRISYAVFCLKQ